MKHKERGKRVAVPKFGEQLKERLSLEYFKILEERM